METRLGDIIDDFCVKCKRIMNHAVVSILDSKPAKVRCRTCYNDHDYRFETAPPPKIDPRKLALMAEKAAAAAAAVALTSVNGEGEVPAAEQPEIGVPAGDIPAGDIEEAPPKAKAKARGRK